eukprot:2633467-Pleurochrysis_carterae.AAC.1
MPARDACESSAAPPASATSDKRARSCAALRKLGLESRADSESQSKAHRTELLIRKLKDENASL